MSDGTREEGMKDIIPQASESEQETTEPAASSPATRPTNFAWTNDVNPELPPVPHRRVPNWVFLGLVLLIIFGGGAGLLVFNSQVTLTNVQASATASANVQDAVLPTPTATPSPSPTPTPSGSPTWSVSPTSFTVTDQTCPLGNNDINECLVQITYNSNGNPDTATWEVQGNLPEGVGYRNGNGGTLSYPTGATTLDIFVQTGVFCNPVIGSFTTTITFMISWEGKEQGRQNITLACP